MANESLQANVARENAMRRVRDELVPRQALLNQQYGPPPAPPQPIGIEPIGIAKEQIGQYWDQGGSWGGDTGAPAPSGPSGPATSNGTVGFASALGNAVSSLGPAMAVPGSSLAALAIALSNMNNPDDSSAVDAGMANSMDTSAGVAPGPGPDSATDASSVGAVNGADAASDAAAAAAADGGGGGAGGGKIVCTAMNQAYGFGSYRQAIWLNYSAKQLTKEHERGYHRIFRPLVRYAFYSGDSFPKRTLRHWLETIMRLRTADLRAEMRGKNPHPIRRAIRRSCEYICYLVGKL